MPQLPPVWNFFPSVYFVQGFSSCNSVFMFLTCLKHFLTYRMKPHTAAWHTMFWPTSSVLPTLPVLCLPGLSSSCSSQIHQPVLCSMPLPGLFSLLGKYVYPSGPRKFLLVDLHISSQASLPLRSLLVSSITFIALNCLDWSS